MTDSLISTWIEGIGLLGPGFDNWPQARAILAGSAPFAARAAVLPAAALPPAERRRAGATIRVTLAAGLEAVAQSGLAAADLASVFTSSSGDGNNCQEICAALASGERMISPTRFHNSVHNAAAGYWGIATGSMAPSSALCGYDGSFAAGLLEAMVQTRLSRCPVVLLAYDTPYPEPLFSARPVPDSFCVSMVLAPYPSGHSLARLQIDPRSAFSTRPADRMANAVLERMRGAIPAARCLPLLSAIAQSRPAILTIGYLDSQQLDAKISPC